LQQGTIVFSPSSPDGSFAILTLPKSLVAQKSPMKKKDKLNKKEQETAETHLLKFGDSIRQLE
jgi:hypothetical protein